MKLSFKIIILIIAIIVFAAILTPKPQIKVCFKDNCFSVELANTPAERERGLMFRNQLGEDRGMLFVFDKEGRHPFWMKNTLIPLDIIWIDKNNKVVFINKNSQPCEENDCPIINSEVFAKYVLEINAGTAERVGLKIGDEAEIIP